ncbi:c-type cytochrome [Halioxenophilus aromaticivorans]|uniref:Cytochrome c domain-containing protein n=1 Tax=Halioxenophilus aromaticivorans TaxID=1306992 RepID=A0AAV3U636_9ALTE
MVASVCLAAFAASFFLPQARCEETTGDNKTQAKIHYMLQCQGCHLANGTGTTTGVPDMTEYGALLLKQKQGRKFFIQVPGASNAALNNKQLAAVLNYIVDEILQADDVDDFTEQEIANSRGKPLGDVVAHRKSLISSLAEPQ